jgi:hypothetical protein
VRGIALLTLRDSCKCAASIFSQHGLLLLNQNPGQLTAMNAIPDTAMMDQTVWEDVMVRSTDSRIQIKRALTDDLACISKHK